MIEWSGEILRIETVVKIGNRQDAGKTPSGMSEVCHIFCLLRRKKMRQTKYF